MSGKFFAHSFDARSVMLFASIAVTSAMASAQPLSSSQQRIGQAASGSRIIQVDRQLGPNDPRRHQARQPVKKSL